MDEDGDARTTPTVLSLVVTEEHRDRAVLDFWRSGRRLSRSCLIYQALRDAFPAAREVRVWGAEAVVDGRVWSLDAAGRALTHVDADDWGTVELPVTVTLTDATGTIYG